MSENADELDIVSWVFQIYQNKYVKIILFLFSFHIAFVSGIFTNIGWEFIAIVRPEDIIFVSVTFVSISFFLVFLAYKLLLVFFEFLRVTYKEITSDELVVFPERSEKSWKYIGWFVLISMFIIMTLAFDRISHSRFDLNSGDEFGRLTTISIFLGLIVARALIASSLSPLYQKAFIGLGVVGGYLWLWFIGSLWVVYVKSESNPVAIYQKNKKLEDARILFSAGEGLLVFFDGKKKPVYLAWSSIERMDPIVGSKAQKK